MEAEWMNLAALAAAVAVGVPLVRRLVRMRPRRIVARLRRMSEAAAITPGWLGERAQAVGRWLGLMEASIDDFITRRRPPIPLSGALMSGFGLRGWVADVRGRVHTTTTFLRQPDPDPDVRTTLCEVHFHSTKPPEPADIVGQWIYARGFPTEILNAMNAAQYPYPRVEAFMDVVDVTSIARIRARGCVAPGVEVQSDGSFLVTLTDCSPIPGPARKRRTKREPI